MRPLHIVSSMATKALLEALAREWHAQGGAEVRVESIGGVDALRRVAEGERFDLVVLASEGVERLLAGGRVVAGTRVDLVKSEVAIAVRAGAPRPRIDTAEALRATLPEAGRIAYSTGPSGVAVQGLIERWGLADALRERLVQAPPGVPVATLLANGDADLGFQQRSELVGMPSIEILGPMPPGAEIVTTFSAACCSASDRPAEVRTLLNFFASAAAGEASLRHGMAPALQRIGLVGYGEVGRILAEDLRARGLVVRACDLKLARDAEAAPLRRHAEAHGVELVAAHAALAAASDLVVSAVTASQTVAVAEACAAGCSGGTWFLDFNSASPGAKAAAARAVNGAGGRYVEGAVMTSVPPHRLRVPLLLGGPDAAALAGPLNALGFRARVASDRLGVASATKMCRSIVIKGLEAMLIESLVTARHHGVEDAVVASLVETFPGIEWERQASYFFQRVIEHGRRRSEEVREVAQTVREAGLEPWSAAGTAERQAWVADLADAGVFGPRSGAGFARSDDWRTEADRVLAQLRKNDGAERLAPPPEEKPPCS